MKQFLLKIPDEIHKEIKMFSVEKKKSMNELFIFMAKKKFYEEFK